MSSPFPGMDPYLEDPDLWPGLHQRLITYLGDTLNAQLPPHYIADIGERLYVVQPGRPIYPDVVLFEQPDYVTSEWNQGGVAVGAVCDPPLVLTVPPDEMREVFIEILAVADEKRVVTIIEVLSPSNKTTGSEGRELYLTKQREVLQSQTHLMEIDLLREGKHTVAAPRERLSHRGHWDYLISLHRAEHRWRYEVWTFTMRQRLPRILVPLAEGDPDVVLDLQKVLDRCYDEGAYVRRLDYQRIPAISLKEEDAQWADELLRERGLR